MSNKLPFNKEFIEKIAAKYPTPFHLYDEKQIKENIANFKATFDWIEGGFKDFFAVKALPNPRILKIMQEAGWGADCSSLPELLLAEKAGITGENIMFTANNTPLSEMKKADSMGAIINFDDISHVKFFEDNLGHLPKIGCLRYNPGPLKQGNEIIGNPEEAKYGFTREQALETFAYFKSKGIKRFGLHTMVASNEINPDYFIETAEILFDLAAEIFKKVGIEFEFINLGGGIGIPYKPEDQAIDLQKVSNGIKDLYETKLINNGHQPCKIVMECGRYVTGPYGWLITKVRHFKNIYKKYAGVDACMANLMRPGMYGAYHEITVLGKENQEKNKVYDVAGSLCENNDKFAIDRKLPQLEIGDILAIHNTGAHGYAMGFNYNGKLRSAELLLKENQEVELIRRAETVDDYFSTLNF